MLIAPSVEDSCSLFSSLYWHLSFCGKTNGVGRADQSVLASEDRIKSLSGAYEGIMEEVELEMEEWERCPPKRQIAFVSIHRAYF
ncbi:unnamed protein product [Rodentolepis nana]|uniref:Uncharacterized protein n=1 Tax=Rodentolepis nana TaxID=102285 RepID=A0A0R3TVZ9_RODNA|nr:unnamed protein product [Rodentolepis nana]